MYSALVYILGQQALRYPLALVHSIPLWLVWTEIECTMHDALPKGPINQFKPAQQSRQQVIKAYCPNKQTVYSALELVHCVNNEGSFFRSNWGRARHLIRLVITQYVEDKVLRWALFMRLGQPSVGQMGSLEFMHFL